MAVYVDTSAAAKLVVDEAESAAVADYLQDPVRRTDLVSSYLLHAELHCAAGRRGDEFPVASVAAVLAAVDLVDVDRADLLGAATLPGRLRSADAIHLATALRVGADEMVVYDAELSRAAAAAGLRVTSPGTGIADRPS